MFANENGTPNALVLKFCTHWTVRQFYRDGKHKPRPHVFEFIVYAVYRRSWSSHNPTRYTISYSTLACPQAFSLASLSEQSLGMGLF